MTMIKYFKIIYRPVSDLTTVRLHAKEKDRLSWKSNRSYLYRVIRDLVLDSMVRVIGDPVRSFLVSSVVGIFRSGPEIHDS